MPVAPPRILWSMRTTVDAIAIRSDGTNECRRTLIDLARLVDHGQLGCVRSGDSVGEPFFEFAILL
jgi:hypothetical protein